jgi:hypothetical protein
MDTGRSTPTTVVDEELALAARNHGLPLEALRYSITPTGLHYTLTHYEIPDVDPRTWRLHLTGLVAHPATLGQAGPSTFTVGGPLPARTTTIELSESAGFDSRCMAPAGT